MSNFINNQNQKKTQGILPVWFTVLFATVVIIALSTIGLNAYQKKSGTPQPSVQNAQLEILKQQILQQDDAIDTHWLHTLNPLVKKVRGRLLWSSAKQQGVMEFSDLPTLSKNQKFLLWIYDLNAETTLPIEAIFEITENFNQVRLMIPFTASEIIKNPLKFELLLKEKGVKASQQLLLAQP